MKKIYHLGTCSTNQRILKAWGSRIGDFVLQDIKREAITEEQLEEMKELAGSYEALFSKVAMKYRKWGLHERTLSEEDYKKYILEEYTFLKRPVMINGNAIFIGSAPKTVGAADASL